MTPHRSDVAADGSFNTDDGEVETVGNKFSVFVSIISCTDFFDRAMRDALADFVDLDFFIRGIRSPLYKRQETF